MTHATTLFSLFEAEITSASVKFLGPLAVKLVERELAAENLPEDTFGRLRPSEFEVGRTSSRSVLGTMSDMRFHIERAAHQSGGSRMIDLGGLNRSLRRIPFSAINYQRPIDRARALLADAKSPALACGPDSATVGDRIDDLLTRFLADRRQGRPSREFRNYEAVIDFFKLHLNGYAYESLSPSERKRWEHAVNSGDEAAFCRLFGPDKIPGEVGAFVGYFMIRKVIGPKTVTAATGRIVGELLEWLVAQGSLKPEEVTQAGERAAAAAPDLPNAEKLASLLYELAELSTVDVQALSEDDYVEDDVTISRVEATALWFDSNRGEIGPLRVGTAISRIAKPGWSINLVMGRRRGSWHLVEVGNVYPD